MHLWRCQVKVASKSLLKCKSFGYEKRSVNSTCSCICDSISVGFWVGSYIKLINAYHILLPKRFVGSAELEIRDENVLCKSS